MTTITTFKTISYGGMEGRTLVERQFANENLARADAMADDWNENFVLYATTLVVDERVTTTETLLGNIPCGRDALRIANAEKAIEEAVARIEEHKANTRIKETTREKRIANEMGYIAYNQQIIKERKA